MADPCLRCNRKGGAKKQKIYSNLKDKNADISHFAIRRCLGLYISWPKTKIHNVGAGTQSLADITVDGNLEECVESFV